MKKLASEVNSELFFKLCYGFSLIVWRQGVLYEGLPFHHVDFLLYCSITKWQNCSMPFSSHSRSNILLSPGSVTVLWRFKFCITRIKCHKEIDIVKGLHTQFLNILRPFSLLLVLYSLKGSYCKSFEWLSDSIFNEDWAGNLNFQFLSWCNFMQHLNALRLLWSRCNKFHGQSSRISSLFFFGPHMWRRKKHLSFKVLLVMESFQHVIVYIYIYIYIYIYLWRLN